MPRMPAALQIRLDGFPAHPRIAPMPRPPSTSMPPPRSSDLPRESGASRCRCPGIFLLTDSAARHRDATSIEGGASGPPARTSGGPGHISPTSMPRPPPRGGEARRRSRADRGHRGGVTAHPIVRPGERPPPRTGIGPGRMPLDSPLGIPDRSQGRSGPRERGRLRPLSSPRSLVGVRQTPPSGPPPPSRRSPIRSSRMTPPVRTFSAASRRRRGSTGLSPHPVT